MKIENIDALKRWLINYLTPIFEGDPAKLASYVIALSKKIENDQASRERCTNDLEVFLESQTNSFVDKLFNTLTTKSYLQQPSSAENVTSQNEIENENRLGTSSGTNYQARSRDYQEIDVRSSTNTASRRHNKLKGRNSRHRDSSSSSSSSSTSSLNRHRRRSRSRSLSRSLSPASVQRSHDTNNGNNNNSNKKQRCRDYDEKGFCTMAELCPFDHDNVVIAPLNSTNSSIPNSLGNNSAFNQPQSSQFQPQQQQHQQFQQKHLMAKRRNNNNNQLPHQHQQQRFNKNLPPPQLHQQQQMGQMQHQQQQQLQAQQRQSMPMINMNRPRNLVNIVTSVDQNEQQSMPFDNQMMMMNQQPMQQPQRGMKRSYNSANSMRHSISQPLLNQPVPELNPDLFYNVDANNPMMNHQPPMMPPQYGMNQQQGLLPTPQQMPMPAAQMAPHHPSSQQQQQPQPQLQQAQMSSNQPTTNNSQNTSLVVKKIPVDLNTVDKLRQHFCKFGQLMDIVCNYENNKDSALIVFATNPQAFAAFKSPQPVFNNRFIRLYWLNNYQKLQQQQQQQHQQHQLKPSQQQQQQQSSDEPLSKKPVKERLSFVNSNTNNNGNSQESLNKENQGKAQQPSSTQTVNESQGNKEEGDAKPVQTPTRSTSITESKSLSSDLNSLSIKSALNTAKQIQDENNKKAYQLKLEVQQKARELMEKQIKDQKLLMQKLDQAKTTEEKSQIIELIKKIGESIEKEKQILEKIRTELSSFNSSPSSMFSFSKTAKPSSPSIPPPPHYLKLNNKRLNNTNFLKTGAKPASTLGVAPKPKVVPSSTYYSYSRVSVDHRPKQLLFSGVENVQEKQLVINFLNTIGCQIESMSDHVNNSDQETPVDSKLAFLVNFVTRKDAEVALSKCSTSLANKSISITWHKPANTKQSQQQPSEPKNEEKNGSESTPSNENEVTSGSNVAEEEEEQEEASENIVSEETNNSNSQLNDSLLDQSSKANDSLLASTATVAEGTTNQFESGDNSDVFDCFFTETNPATAATNDQV